MLQKKSPVTFPLTRIAVVDIESRSLRARYDATVPIYFVGIGAIDDEGVGEYLRYDIESAVAQVQYLLDEGWTIVMHNAAFDYGILKTHGLKWTIEPGKLSIVCTMAMAYGWNSSLPSYSLDALTGEKTDLMQSCIDAGIDVPTKPVDFWAEDWSANDEVLELMAEYLKQDVRATLKLYKAYAAKYNDSLDKGFSKTLAYIDFPMLDVLTMMESTGAYIDKPMLLHLNRELAEERLATEQALRERYGKLPKLQWKGDCYVPVETVYKKGYYRNKLHAPAHYMDADGSIVASDSTIVYDYCQLIDYNSAAATGHNWWILQQTCPAALAKASVTDTGKPKLDKDYFADVAEKLPADVPIANLLKLTKRLQKTEELLECLQIDGRLHSRYNNCQTRTGRLSSSKPNLCNLERADKQEHSVASRFRQMFIAPEGKCFLVADLDQAEIRVLAYYLAAVCNDKSMAALSFDKEADVHQANADAWGVERMVAKTLIFLLVYGGGAGKIFAKGYTKSLAEAQALFEQVHKSQPSIQTLKQKVWETAAKRGYLSNPFCARGIYGELYSKDRGERSSGERKCFNYLIQRTARDVMHYLLIESYAVVSKYEGAAIVNSIYDECHIECKQEDAERLLAELNQVWQDRRDILPGVSINGDWNKGDNWYKAK